MIGFVVASLVVLADALPFEPSFTMMLGSPKDRAPVLKVSAADMRTCNVTEENGGHVYVWKGHATCGKDFSVTGRFVRKGRAWEYSFGYAGCEAGLDVEEISFPEITVPRTDKTRLLGPKQTGELRLPDWAKVRPGEVLSEYGPMFVGFRFLASIDEASECWYVDQRGDARLRPSRYVFANGMKPQTLKLSACYIPPAEPGLRRAGGLPFTGEIRRFRGGWYQAASFYRDWVRKQDWFVRAKARDFGKLRDVALWMWNRGRSDVVAPPVEKFMADTGLPAALDWYWWHEIPYDTSYPNFWPPREPVADFRRTIARLQAKGAYVQTYTNGMLWDCADPDYAAKGAGETLIKRDGTRRTQVFNIFTKADTGWTCGHAPNFQKRIRKVERELAASGLDAVYMDMIANCAYCDCWSEEHGHPRGGGTAVADGYRRLLQAVRAENPGVQISSEEEGEPFLELVDSLIVLYACYERLGRGTAPKVDMPPVFQAIYHGAVAMYGSYSLIDGVTPWDEKWGERPAIDEARWAGRFKDQFACEFARGIVQGVQPCVHKVLLTHETDPKWAEDWKFVRDSARFYYDNREFLFDGEMRDPGRLTCECAPVDFFIRGCYTPEDKFKTCRQEALPTVFHSVWKAPDGQVAAVLVNRTRKAQSYRLETPDVKAEGVLPPLSWKKIPAPPTARTSRPLRVGLAERCVPTETEPLEDYVWAITEAGHDFVDFRHTTDPREISKMVSEVDVVMFSGAAGGDAVNPAIYGQKKTHVEKVSDTRDAWEGALLREAIRQGKGVVGICRGCQFINAAMGGTLCQSIAAFHPNNVGHGKLTNHVIRIESDSRLAGILGTNAVVNSWHALCIERPAPHMRVVARTADGIPEAIEHETLPIAACQFHPEVMLWNKDRLQAVYQMFVQLDKWLGLKRRRSNERQQWSCYRSFNKEFPAMKRFADAGIVTRCFTLGNTVNSAGNPYCQYPVVWKGRDKYDWETIDREFQDMVDVSPNVKFVVLLDLNTPPWLQRWLRFDSFSMVSLAAADPDWLKLTIPWLTAFISHAEEKWGERTVGYLLGAGNCTEWTEYSYGEDRPRIFSSEAQDAAWRNWCAKKGVDHGASTPGGAALYSAAFRNTIYDPATESAKIDYWKFRNESVADALLAFAHEAKRLAPGKEIGAFFGYSLLCNPGLFLSWSHMDYERVYDSPDIDFIAAPANYTNRGCGGGTGALVPLVSLSRRGKRYMHEIDFWPHDVHPAGQVFDAGYFKTLEDDIAGNMREAAFAFVTHASLWWFDQWGRFYNSPALFDRIAQAEEIRCRLADDRSPSTADVLLVVDPESAYHFNERSPVLEGYPWRIRDELAKTGFATDTCTFSDLAHMDLARYRAVFLTDQVVVTPERRAFLDGKVCTGGRTVVWFYAPGICDGKSLAEDRVCELTGVPFGGKGEKDFGSWRSVYYPDYASFDAKDLAQVLRKAGAHAWCDCPCVVHANARLFSVHLKDGGMKTVRLPHRASKVVELFSGKTVSENSDRFNYLFASPDTRIFEMTGN